MMPPNRRPPSSAAFLAAAALLLALALAGCQAAEEFASEGSEGSPIGLGGIPATYEGQVGPMPESSFYSVPAAGDTTYTISLSGLVNDAILVVDQYQGLTLVGQLCAAVSPGATSISCMKLTTAGIDSLKIRVLSYSEDGTDFLLIIN